MDLCSFLFLYGIIKKRLQLFCLSYIGMAAAIGHPIDIPVLIRALACDYYRSGTNLSILTDKNFVQSLDAATPEDDPSAIVDQYAYRWWTLPLAEDMEILAESNVEECIEFHHLSAKTQPVVPGRFEKLKYSWCRDLAMDPRGVDIQCRRCKLYRAVSIGAADDVQDLRHQWQGWEEYFKTHSYAVARESIGFFELYQAAIRKELNAGGTDAPASNAGGSNAGGSNAGGPNADHSEVSANGIVYSDAADSQQSPPNTKFNQATRLRSEEVRLEAAANLVRLQSLPNVKWTWGPDLSDDEAVKYLRPAPRLESAHSGYAESLQGSLDGDWSSHASLTFGSEIFSEGDVQPIRELLPHEYPTHFEDPPLRHYFGEAPVLVDGHLEEPPAPVEIRPVSVLHPPPADYISRPPDTYFNCEYCKLTLVLALKVS
jgi:hypothetical protein